MRTNLSTSAAYEEETLGVASAVLFVRARQRRAERFTRTAQDGAAALSTPAGVAIPVVAKGVALAKASGVFSQDTGWAIRLSEIDVVPVATIFEAPLASK